MADKKTWDDLQSRWASGDPLSGEQEKARLDAAEGDPLALRELSLFRELARSMDSKGVAPVGLVSKVLRAHRGSSLRLVEPEERAPARRPLLDKSGWRGFGLAAAGTLLVFAATRLLSRTEPVELGASPTVTALSAPPVRTQTRVELVFFTRDVQVDEAQATVGGQPLARGARLVTRTGRACITIDPSAVVCAGSGAELVLESLEPADVRIGVLSGAAVAKLSRRAPGHGFTLSGGGVDAKARGTVFVLERDAQRGAAQVSVLEGEVEVRRSPGQIDRLGAHGSLAFTPSAPARAATLGRAEEARYWSLLTPQKLWDGNTLGILEIAPSTADERAWIDGQGSYELPLAAYAVAGRHEIVFSSSRGAESRLDATVEAGARQRLTAPSQSALPRVASPALHAPDLPATLLGKARAKLAVGDRSGARTLYRKLRSAYPGSPEATTVLVTLGKLELDLGASDRALAAFEAYLTRGGPLAPEALSGKIRALRALGRKEEERRAIEVYLARYADGFAVPSLRRRLERLAE